MMRILWVNTVGVLGGAERSLAELMPPLAELGHDLIVAAPKGPLAQTLAASGTRLYEIPAVRLRRPNLRHPARLAGWLTLLAARRRLAHIIQDNQPDLIHANSLTAMLALPKVDLPPIIWHVRDLELHPMCARLAARHAQTIIAISPAVGDHLRIILPSEQHDKIQLIPNGIQLPDTATLPSQADARRTLGLPQDVLIVGMLAHFIPWKRHDRLIEAAAALAPRMPEVNFLFSGGDLFGEHTDYQHQIRQKIEKSGIEQQVIMFGATVQPLTFLRALDLLVHPAENEPFGRVICEAMAVGTPVLAMKQGGPDFILEHDVTGWLVDPNDPKALPEAIVHLLKKDTLRARLGRQAATKVRQAYDIRNTAAHLSACYIKTKKHQRRCC